MPPLNGEHFSFGEFLKPHGLNASRPAQALGVPPNRVSAIIHSERAVTAQTALMFARAFGTTAQFWLNLQMAHDLQSAAGREFGKSLCGWVAQPVWPSDAPRAERTRETERENVDGKVPDVSPPGYATSIQFLMPVQSLPSAHLAKKGRVVTCASYQRPRISPSLLTATGCVATAPGTPSV